MEKRIKSPVASGKIKKKMTKEQVELAIIRKKECDAKALKIVERLVEPDVDPDWLMENLKDINKCHMEDVIEERAIEKVCGYVLCQKPLTVVYNQRYHISLKDKKVYDVTKRKNFCSSSCFGASNYLLEQMLTSPLWLRDNEEIPKFRIFHKVKQDVHGQEVNITDVKNANQENTKQNIELQDLLTSKDNQSEKRPLQTEAKEEIAGCIQNFVLEAVQNFELKGLDSTVDKTYVTVDNQTNIGVESTAKNKDVKTTENTDVKRGSTDKESQAHGEANDSTCMLNVDQPTDDSVRANSKKHTILGNQIKIETTMNNNIDVIDTDDDIIEQCIYPIEDEITHSNIKHSDPLQKSDIESDDVIEQFSYQVPGASNEICTVDSLSFNVKSTQDFESDGAKLPNDPTPKSTKNIKQKAHKKLVDVNLAAKVETSFREWVTDQTIDYLFGDEPIRQQIIKAIEIQENYKILCNKLDRLQAQEDREDAEMLEMPALKPAPHFAVLKEEGEKLDLKVRAFYDGSTTFGEPPPSNANIESSDGVETFLPLTDVHAATTVRRKFFLERLDQVLPDLLRTLAGNNDVYARASLNYSSVRCIAVKALLHTFSLSAKNIVFKTAEWTLVGLVIIKMLSLSDPYLASLLATKQANMYISMILTAYKLNPDYLNLLVTSFNPNMNPR